MIEAPAYSAKGSAVTRRKQACNDPSIELLRRKAACCAVGAIGQVPGYGNQELIMHRRWRRT